VDVYQGGPQGTLLYSNPVLPVKLTWVQQLQAADANSHLLVRVSDGVNIIVQLAVDDGKTLNMVTVLPE
jgi:hypothetical protein